MKNSVTLVIHVRPRRWKKVRIFTWFAVMVRLGIRATAINQNDLISRFRAPAWGRHSFDTTPVSHEPHSVSPQKRHGGFADKNTLVLINIFARCVATKLWCHKRVYVVGPRWKSRRILWRHTQKYIKIIRWFRADHATSDRKPGRSRKFEKQYVLE